MKIITILTLGLILVIIFSSVNSNKINIDDENNLNQILIDDLDPFINLKLTVDIISIRALDEIDSFSDPDFFIKIKINEKKFRSPIFIDKSNLNNVWNVTYDIPDDIETVDVNIQLWDWDPIKSNLCDISQNADKNHKDANLIYNLKTGRWHGDDYTIEDPSGYGRLNGCDDGSIYTNEKDCELSFNIFTNDFDNDYLPYYTEQFVYYTDPRISNIGNDFDNDQIPIEWEHRWGYNPLIWDNHLNLDYDKDSINNFEEYLTSNFLSDPFRSDIFVEIDWMEDSPEGISSVVPEEAKELMKIPFHRRNIVVHFDTGEQEGGEIIPFDDDVTIDEVLEIYDKYFLHNGHLEWRRGVFHYGFFVYLCKPNGYAFNGDGNPFWGYGPGTNAFIISSRLMVRMADNVRKSVSYIFAASIMHEMGHNFGIRFSNPFGCDNSRTVKPWYLSFWLFKNYKSIMNYRYTYYIMDYSDGSHGQRDFNDWAEIKIDYFEQKLKT